MQSNTTTAAAFNDRLTSLTPRLTHIARDLVGSLSEHTAEDILQEIVLKLLERAHQDPTFASRSDKELLIFAQWRGRHLAEKGRIYTGYVQEEEYLSNANGVEISSFEFIAGDDPNPEQACIELEELEALERIAAALDPTNRRIVRMLYQGYSSVEIAAHLGVTKGAVSQRKAIIAGRITAGDSLPA